MDNTTPRTDAVARLARHFTRPPGRPTRVPPAAVKRGAVRLAERYGVEAAAFLYGCNASSIARWRPYYGR